MAYSSLLKQTLAISIVVCLMNLNLKAQPSIGLHGTWAISNSFGGGINVKAFAAPRLDLGVGIKRIRQSGNIIVDNKDFNYSNGIYPITVMFNSYVLDEGFAEDDGLRPYIGCEIGGYLNNITLRYNGQPDAKFVKFNGAVVPKLGIMLALDDVGFFLEGCYNVILGDKGSNINVNGTDYNIQRISNYVTINLGVQLGVPTRRRWRTKG